MVSVADIANNMITGFVVTLLVAAALTVALVFATAVVRFRGKRVVTCPETQKPVGVEVDAITTARTALLNDPRFLITACSRWPERKGCDQACVPQIEASPDETLVRNIVADWYQGKTCVYCRKPIGGITGTIVPALRTTDGVLHDWDSIAPGDLPSLLGTAAAVCAHCELAEDFRLRFPQLVTDRAETPLRNRAVY
jgi:hypothetical protein